MHDRRGAEADWPGPYYLLPVACAALWLAAVSMMPRAVCQNASTPPGGALRIDKADMPTAINQLPDKNEQMRSHDRAAMRKNFDAANTLRIQQIAGETEKLLRLAQDLKAQMEKTEEKPLPAILLREAEIIELLAHDVQEKMAKTVGGG
jgi:hypothetical protein